MMFARGSSPSSFDASNIDGELDCAVTIQHSSVAAGPGMIHDSLGDSLMAGLDATSGSEAETSPLQATEFEGFSYG